MHETKIVLVLLSLFLLIGAGFCIFQFHTEKKVGHHREIGNQYPSDKKHKKFCLITESYYLTDEDIVDSNCSWSYGGQRCENH